ncbi:MAG: hypothetical protein OEL66_08830 [Desulfobulbaceae bacterium]|nr:hypothetical protein [Desulfobulbaceae bacterium]
MRCTSWAEKPKKPVLPSSRRRAVHVCPLSPVLRLAVFYSFLVAVHTSYFVYVNGGGIWSVVASAPSGFLLGVILFYFGKMVCLIREKLLAGMRPMMAGFLLFFLFQVGYILAFSVVVSMPVEWCINAQGGTAQVARLYVLYSMNLIMVMAILSWLRWLLQMLEVYRGQSKRKG